MRDRGSIPKVNANFVAPVTLDAMQAIGLLEASPDDPDMLRLTHGGRVVCGTLLTMYIMADKRVAFELISEAKRLAKESA